jgi:hypothetical protein
MRFCHVGPAELFQTATRRHCKVSATATTTLIQYPEYSGAFSRLNLMCILLIISSPAPLNAFCANDTSAANINAIDISATDVLPPTFSPTTLLA